jgi:hypothetical protein
MAFDLMPPLAPSMMPGLTTTIHHDHHHHHHHTPARASPGTGRNCNLVGRCREQRRIESQVPPKLAEYFTIKKDLMRAAPKVNPKQIQTATVTMAATGNALEPVNTE